jgi:hypothetical protein
MRGLSPGDLTAYILFVHLRFSVTRVHEKLEPLPEGEESHNSKCREVFTLGPG